MSKYIRLKDGTICDDGNKYNIDEEGNYCEIETFMGRSEEVIMISKKNIVKESDNLEDLCDEFILFDDENKIHYKSQEGSIWWLGASLYPKSVRGAIFTNEGIIYVTKMVRKENGEIFYLSKTLLIYILTYQFQI